MTAPVAGLPRRLSRRPNGRGSLATGSLAPGSLATGPLRPAPPAGVPSIAGTVSAHRPSTGSQGTQGPSIPGPHQLWPNNSGVFTGTPSSFQPLATSRGPGNAPARGALGGANALWRSVLPLGVRPLVVPSSVAYPSEMARAGSDYREWPARGDHEISFDGRRGGAPGPMGLAHSLSHPVSVAPPGIARVSHLFRPQRRRRQSVEEYRPNTRSAPGSGLSGAPAQAISRARRRHPSRR